MARTVRCPSCSVLLRFPASFAQRTLTCSRCLAEVAISDEGNAAQRVSPGDECPACGEPVRPTWRVCPACDEWLQGPIQKPLPFADRQARQDTRLVGIGFAVLGVLALGGILIVGANWLNSYDSGRPESRWVTRGGQEITMLTVGASLVLVVLSLGAAIVLCRKPENPDKPAGLRRVVVRNIGVAGTVLVAFLLLVLASAVFFLGTCAAILSSI